MYDVTELENTNVGSNISATCRFAFCLLNKNKLNVKQFQKRNFVYFINVALLFVVCDYSLITDIYENCTDLE